MKENKKKQKEHQAPQLEQEPSQEEIKKSDSFEQRLQHAKEIYKKGHKKQDNVSREGIALDGVVRVSADLLAPIIFCTGMGYMAGRYFHHMAMWMVAGFILGAVTGIYNVYKLSIRLDEGGEAK